MLEDVDTIDWQSLGYPQVPDLLRQLMSDDFMTLVEATERLEKQVILGGVHWEEFDQGMGISVALRNDAPLLLVPFLLKIPESTSGGSNRFTLHLLDRMLHYKFMVDEGAIYKRRVENIRTAIWEGRQIYIDLLSSDDLHTRILALGIMMHFNEATRIVEAYELVVRRFEPALPPDAD